MFTFYPFLLLQNFLHSIFLQLNLTSYFYHRKEPGFPKLFLKSKKNLHKSKYLKVTDTMGKREVADCSIEL